MSADYARLYGPGVNIIDNLSNLIVGATSSVSQRFRAPKSGYPKSVKVYFISSGTSPGYSMGTGGKIRIRVYPDNGTSAHLPDLSKAPIAEGLHLPNLVNGKPPAGYFPEVSLSASSALQAGSLYHVVYENVDSNPAANFVSVNSALTWAENGRPSRWLQATDFAVLLGSRPAGSSWKDYSTGVDNLYLIPTMQIALTNGEVFGNADMETGNVSDRHWHVTSSRPVRERFKSGVTRTVRGLSVMTAASRAGALRWELKEGSSILAQGEINQATANYTTVTSRSTGRFKWYDVELPHNVTLAAGSTVDLVFTAIGTSEWVFADERNGADYGFKWPASFNESQAQHLYSGTWYNANHNDHSLSATTSNWRVVLHQTP